VREQTLRRRVAQVQRKLAARYEDSLLPPQPVAQGSGGSGSGTSRPRPLSPTEHLLHIAARRCRLIVVRASGAIFYRDVRTDAWYAPYVAAVITAHIAEGYRRPNGQLTGVFGVDKPVTRAEVIKMALEAAGKADALPDLLPENSTDQGTWAGPYVRSAEDRGLTVFRGAPDVNAPATRGEVIQTILEVLSFPIGTTPAAFADVPPDHPYGRAIAVAAFYGVVEGDRGSDGALTHTFRPDAPMNRAEVAKLIALARELVKK
jgi:hypothetical protein